MRDRIPLQASATSRAMAGRMITLPSRKTGTPIQGKVVLATLDASNCSGKVIWLKTMAGMGIINSRNAQGKRRARKKLHPRNRTIKLPRTINSDKRERKSSAPIWPTTSTHSPTPRNSRPHQEGFRVRVVSRERSCQITKAENRGTKKPWEKLGSFHHCPTRWARIGEYSQSNSAPITTACHGARAGLSVGAGVVLFSVCGSRLTNANLTLGG